MESSFPIEIYFLAAGAGLAFSYLSSRFWLRQAESWKLVDHPGHRKIHATPMPLVGGLIVAFGLFGPLLLAALSLNLQLMDREATELLRYGFGKRTLQLIGILAGGIGMLLLGLLDDRHTLSAGKKLSGQILIAAVVAATGTRITLFVPDITFSYVITILWFITLVNAFNFTDNMNGLCAGLGAISAVLFALHAALPGHYLVACFGFLVAGALLGFMPLNYPTAKTFLGDSGSHLIGYLIATMAVLPHFHHETQLNKLTVITPLLVLGIVLVDFLWVIGYRLSHGHPVYLGDNNHLSHQLVKRGFSKPLAVLLLWLAHLAIGATSFLLNK